MLTCQNLHKDQSGDDVDGGAQFGATKAKVAFGHTGGESERSSERLDVERDQS